MCNQNQPPFLLAVLTLVGLAVKAALTLCSDSLLPLHLNEAAYGPLVALNCTTAFCGLFCLHCQFFFLSGNAVNLRQNEE